LPGGRTLVQTIPEEAFSGLPSGLQGQAQIEASTSPEAKLHPRLREELLLSSLDRIDEFVITFRDDLRIPRFPEPAVAEQPNSPTNQSAFTEATNLIEQIRTARQSVYAARTRELAPLGVEVAETFWLINAIRVRMPLSAVAILARYPDILYIEPNQTSSLPPNSDPNDDVVKARAYIQTDDLASMWTGGFVGLLDTGVRTSHVLLSNPSPLRYVRDCVNGTSNNCTAGVNLNPDDDCWHHGTASAAIITGNSNLGDAYRGIDWVTLDSFKVYPSGCGALDTSAVIRGFQAALAALDQVIVAEMQGDGSDASSISSAADAAYDAGAIVVAANGNFGPTSASVKAPANAHKVLGIGSFDIKTLAQETGQSRGPAPDGRIKPDLQEPTNTETATAVTNTSVQVFTGTSGATPYAGGLAIAMRNWLFRLGGGNNPLLPGVGYAWMILMGQKAYPFDNISGAGPGRFVPNTLLWQGRVSFSGAGVADFPLDGYGAETTYKYNLAASLWWPEAVSDPHNDIDLFIVDPSGVVRASSTSVYSIFERAQVPGLLAAGTWKLRIQNKGTRSQDIFFGAYRTSS